MKVLINKILNITLICGLVCLMWPIFSVYAFGITYYVDATIGNDNYNGSSISTPFKTIQKAADIMVSGDICYIRGGTYRESVTVKNDYQTFQNYQNEVVTISGADSLPISTTWTYNGKYYTTNQAIDMNLNQETQLFYDGEMNTKARWPNNTGTLLQPTLATVDYVSGWEIGFNSAPSGLDLTKVAGSRLWIVANPSYWSSEAYVTSGSSSSKSNTFSLASSLGMIAGDKFYLTGKIDYLDYPGEWFLDASNKLSIITPEGVAPNNTMIEYKKRLEGITLNGRKGVTIRGVNIFAARITTDDDSNCMDNVIDSITAKYVWHSENAVNQTAQGIRIYGTNNTIKNSSILYSSGSIISLNNTSNKVINNLVCYGNYEAGNCALIDGGGRDFLISNNTVHDSGRACMQLNIQNSQVQYNEMYNAVLLTEDCGVYYSISDGQNTRIHHNKVYGIASINNANHGNGIYLDNSTTTYIIDHNVIWDCYIGIQINTPSDFTVVYNNTVNSSSYASLFSWGSLNGDNMYGFRAFNNIFSSGAGWNDFQITGGSAWGNNLYTATNPQFVNANSKNFHLQVTSPAINAGVVITGITDGYNGTAPDIGAYEYNGADWVAGCNFTTPPNPTYTMPTAQYSNLILNGGFELFGSACWWTPVSGTAPSIFCAVSDNAWGNPNSKSRAQQYALNLNSTTTSIEQTINVKANTYYTFSSWLLTDSGETIVLGVKNYGGTTVQTPNISSLKYKPYSLEFKTGNTTTATIYIKKMSATAGNVYADVAGVIEKDIGSAPESFELGVPSSFSAVYGTTTASTAQYYTGTKSFKINGDQNVISRNLNANYKRIGEIWFYDNSLDTTSKSFGRFDDNVVWRGIGVDTSVSTSKYVYRINNTTCISNISRTIGWHRFNWDYSAGHSLDLYIDGKQIASDIFGIDSFSNISMGDWSSDGITTENGYFDDVSIKNILNESVYKNIELTTSRFYTTPSYEEISYLGLIPGNIQVQSVYRNNSETPVYVKPVLCLYNINGASKKLVGVSLGNDVYIDGYTETGVYQYYTVPSLSQGKYEMKQFMWDSLTGLKSIAMTGSVFSN